MVIDVDVAVIGGGPSGAAAAIYAAQAGFETALFDAARFPRDKTCGDGLTPRAMNQLELLGVEVNPSYRNKGLKLHGFGGAVTAPWPNTYPSTTGTAIARREFDHQLFLAAEAAGATLWEECPASDPVVESNYLKSFSAGEHTVRARWVIVADGVRSPFGKALGRTWHKGEVYGIAARSYCTSPFSDEPWMHSHVELKDTDGSVQPGYGWIFPLGNGTVNLGCGALSTDARPAKINTKKLLRHYAASQQEDWQLGEPQDIASALLPMGGAVSNVAGANWMLIGDAAACVNPLNGEGIDYGLETAQLAVSLLPAPISASMPGASAASAPDFTLLWPDVLREHYGEAFVLARTAARLLTYPQFLPFVGPLGLRGPIGRVLMPAAARLMGNLVTDEDKDLIARAWRLAGKGVAGARKDTPLWDSTLSP